MSLARICMHLCVLLCENKNTTPKVSVPEVAKGTAVASGLGKFAAGDYSLLGGSGPVHTNVVQ